MVQKITLNISCLHKRHYKEERRSNLTMELLHLTGGFYLSDLNIKL